MLCTVFIGMIPRRFLFRLDMIQASYCSLCTKWQVLFVNVIISLACSSGQMQLQTNHCQDSISLLYSLLPIPPFAITVAHWWLGYRGRAPSVNVSTAVYCQLVLLYIIMQAYLSIVRMNHVLCISTTVIYMCVCISACGYSCHVHCADKAPQVCPVPQDHCKCFIAYVNYWYYSHIT